MQFKVMCQGDRPNEYENKKRQIVHERILSLIDVSKGPKFRQSFDYPVSEAEDNLIGEGSADGSFFMFTMTDLRPGFGGVLKASGSLALVDE